MRARAPRTTPPAGRRSRLDRGVALVEFAMVMVLFFTLLFGIINFGVLLAFKQNMTQAASEAARAAIAVTDDTSTTADERKEVALASMQASVSDFNQRCTQSGGTAECAVKIHECDPPVGNFASIVDPTVDPIAPSEPVDPCLTTFIKLDNKGSGRILPPFPIISAFEPDTLTSQTTVRLVPVAI